MTFPSSEVFAFECDPRAVSRFHSRMSSLPQQVASRIQLTESAVSATDGFMDFHCSDGFNPDLSWYTTGWDLSGSLKRPIGAKHRGVETIEFNRRIEVRATTLDSWAHNISFFESRQNVDLVWIDVQGAELDVFHGGGEFLKRVKYIHCECMRDAVYEGQPSADQIEAFLEGRFRLVARYPNDLLFFNPSLNI